mgnify:CR=1 FL=1
MTAQELIQQYNITLQTTLTNKGWEPTGMLAVHDAVACKRDGKLGEVKAQKPEIFAILVAEQDAKKRARAEREAKINAIPGLIEIKSARDDVERWRDEFAASFESEDGGGVGVRPQPKHDLAALYAKYPRAKAYLLADEYADAENYAKAKAGKKALEAIINGEDPESAIAAMEAEWTAYTQSHMWE